MSPRPTACERPPRRAIKVVGQIAALIQSYPTLVFRRLWAMLRRAGWTVNCRSAYQILKFQGRFVNQRTKTPGPRGPQSYRWISAVMGPPIGGGLVSWAGHPHPSSPPRRSVMSHETVLQWLSDLLRCRICHDLRTLRVDVDTFLDHPMLPTNRRAFSPRPWDRM